MDFSPTGINEIKTEIVFLDVLSTYFIVLLCTLDINGVVTFLLTLIKVIGFQPDS